MILLWTFLISYLYVLLFSPVEKKEDTMYGLIVFFILMIVVKYLVIIIKGAIDDIRNSDPEVRFKHKDDDYF